MTDRDDINELLGDTRAEERAELEELVQRLEEEVPYPSPGFRAKLRHRIEMKSRRRRAPLRPGRLRLVIASYAGSGLLLLLVATAGVAGIGPFAA